MIYTPCCSFPITLDNIENGDIFSVYEWIAHDELRITHRQDDLISLERICESIKDNDTNGKWKAMQQACMEESSKLSPLLYFLRHHNVKHILAAHRALILSSMWARKPENLDLLVDAMHAIRILDTGKSQHKPIATTIRAEIWQTLLRPIYRAIFFGFDNVYELNEESFSRLFTDQSWLQQVFRISLDFLKMLEKSDRRADSPNLLDFSDQSKNVSDLWPPLKEDITLQSLARKWQNTHLNSIPIHRGVICSLHLTNDLERIKDCFPNLDKMFLSVSNIIQSSIETIGAIDEKNIQFITEALRRKAEASDLGLDEVIYLGNLFGLTKDFVFTNFILCMYEFGKDEEVDDLVTASARLLNIPEFVSRCIEIISMRLSAILNMLKREKRYRSILSSVDADTCQFVHELSSKMNHVRPVINGEAIIRTLNSSHSLTLRMMRLSTTIRRGEIHSLSILTGVLLQAIQKIS